MSRPALLAFGGLALFGLGAASVTLSAQDPKGPPKAEAVWTRPVVVMSRHERVGGTLEGLQVRTVGGRQFLVGTEAPSGDVPARTLWIPLDDVTQVVELGGPPGPDKK